MPLVPRPAFGPPSIRDEANQDDKQPPPQSPVTYRCRTLPSKWSKEELRHHLGSQQDSLQDHRSCLATREVWQALLPPRPSKSRKDLNACDGLQRWWFRIPICFCNESEPPQKPLALPNAGEKSLARQILSRGISYSQGLQGIYKKDLQKIHSRD